MVAELDEICGVDPDDNYPAEEEEKTGNPTADLKPEFCQYKDEGCEYAAACLACPFPDCFYDNHRGKQRWRKAQRDKEIKRLFQTGRKVKELARLFGLSRKTIQRALVKKKMER